VYARDLAGSDWLMGKSIAQQVIAFQKPRLLIPPRDSGAGQAFLAARSWWR